MRGCRPLLFLLLLASIAGAPSALAQEGTETMDAAEYASKGVELYQQGFWFEAIQHFVAAQGLLPDPSNLYNIARCYDHLGKYKKAADYYQQYIDAGGEQSEKASNYLESIKAIPATVEITSTPSGAMILLDDNTLFSGLTPMKTELEPGKHRILAKLEGYGVQWRDVEVDFDDRITIDFWLQILEGATDLDVGDTPSDVIDETDIEGAPVVDAGGAGVGKGGALHDEGANRVKIVNLLSAAMGLSFPVSFEQVHSFVGGSLLWQFMVKRASAGLGMDLQFGGTAQIYAFYAHGGYSIEFGPGFFLYGRAGAGVGLLRCRHQEIEFCSDIPVSFLARLTVGMGWSRKWFDVRIAAANFLVHVWARRIEGVTAQWLPLLWLGYRY